MGYPYRDTFCPKLNSLLPMPKVCSGTCPGSRQIFSGIKAICVIADWPCPCSSVVS